VREGVKRNEPIEGNKKSMDLGQSYRKRGHKHTLFNSKGPPVKVMTRTGRKSQKKGGIKNDIEKAREGQTIKKEGKPLRLLDLHFLSRRTDKIARREMKKEGMKGQKV